MKDIIKLAILAALFFVIFKGVSYVPEFVGFIRGLVPVFLDAPQEAPADADDTAATSTLPFSITEGFSIGVFASDLGAARDLTRGFDGGLYVSILDRGEVVALFDEDGNGVAERRKIIISDLRAPHGLATRCHDGTCELFVAEEHQVTAYPYDEAARSFGEPRHVTELPVGGNHRTRSLLFFRKEGVLPPDTSTPEEQLLVSIGSTCNVCDERDERRASVISVDPDTGAWELFATGLRNAVFLARHPVTGNVWAGEMGRDWLGDDLPPDEINIVRDGEDYGWPICYGAGVRDSVYDTRLYIRNPCEDKTDAHIEILPAHSSPLGLAFVPEEGWSEDMWFDVLVALHGSWNRSEPSGYKVVRFVLDAQGDPVLDESGKPRVHDFLTGFLDATDRAYGRPVDIYLEPGGTGYISDDRAGAVYRFRRVAQ